MRAHRPAGREIRSPVIPGLVGIDGPVLHRSGRKLVRQWNGVCEGMTGLYGLSGVKPYRYVVLW